jgi:AraC-like DNA-binding protein
MTEPKGVEHSLLGTFVVPVAQALRQLGYDPVQVAADAGIDLAKAANPDWRVSQRTFNALMSQCLQLTGEEAFGLLAAEQLRPQMLHSLGLAWLASDTVYDGLLRLQRFSRLVSTDLDLQLVEEHDLVQLHLGRRVGAVVPVHANRDYAVGIISRMCRLTLGDFLAPVMIELDRPRPERAERWEYLLASRVKFDAPVACISWYRTDIMEPLLTGDPALARINDEHTRVFLDSFLAQSTTREVVDKIVEKLPDGAPSQQQIAEALHVSNRTLQRKLKNEGTSFMDLLQDTRMQLARKYLRSPGRSVVETAYLLGFSEPSTFSRAFKRWTGLAPAEYRGLPEQASPGLR